METFRGVIGFALWIGDIVLDQYWVDISSHRLPGTYECLFADMLYSAKKLNLLNTLTVIYVTSSFD